MQQNIIQMIILILLVFLSAFFSSAETAMSCVSRVRIKTLVDENNRQALRVQKILDDYQDMLSAVLIGNNIVNLSASALATIFVQRIWGDWAISIGTGVLTIVVLILGEIIPKTIATTYAENMALFYAGIILFIMKILTPLIWIVNAVADMVLKIFRVDRNNHKLMTENELKTYVDVSHEDGVIESGEKEIIYNVFEFSDAVAKDVMIPRIDMSCVSSDAEYHEVLRVFKQEMYTRIPVYEGNQDNIIGLINIKDMVLVSDKDNFKISDYLREAYYTYEYKKTADLLMEMRKNAQNVAFVLSEYGATVGMITLEDLLEEIVGEIRDEYDSDEEEQIRELGDGRFLVEGNMKLDDVNDALGTAFESDDYDSIGGLMIENLDRLPRGGETTKLPNGVELTASAIKRNRITDVLVYIPEGAFEEKESMAEAEQPTEEIVK
ncbi:HlyC/CorC family transporter [Butyrivibrio sp. WCE2006]|uniref:HlyC/CorC family transporter n=1 Tax=Butyrivibrio sp. WCE2006 TaxID=1410611 RepID=UPI000A934258|nr:hemolysin family protein [Butyrivibrio sp. WCE2006]